MDAQRRKRSAETVTLQVASPKAGAFYKARPETSELVGTDSI
jgi:hypothetical protein